MNKLGVLVAAGVVLVPGLAIAQTYSSAYEPVAGSPNSLQFQAVRDSLNLFDIDTEGAERISPEGDSDTIGGAFTYWGAGTGRGERGDLHYQHASRVFQGSRARLVVDVPVNILHVNSATFFGFTVPGATAVAATVNAGLELPVKPNWLITPRLSYGIVGAGASLGGNGEIATGSVTSRYQIKNVGRGDLIIGNMIGYTHTLKLLTDKQFYSPTINWVFRNGLAYQLPLKSRMFGRQASLRASYVFTLSTHDQAAYKELHELGLSIGVRTREAEQKSRFEQIRVGVLFTHARNQYDPHSAYNAGTLTFGYRF